ncbi:hypothetical protein OIU77_019786 [Salix suchowensis]|uniref:Transmembrane protein n=1 Tax=Salix suchowensis TaxID=1278906 RepID=A0ABQ9CHA1_9ROSI|nr:hypothetical protein OIU77_019786 [Salix suchowensis]
MLRRDRDEVVEDRPEFLGFDDAITFDDAISGGGRDLFFFLPIFQLQFINLLLLLFKFYFQSGVLLLLGLVFERFWVLSLLFCWDQGDSLDRMKACIERVRFCRTGWAGGVALADLRGWGCWEVFSFLFLL